MKECWKTKKIVNKYDKGLSTVLSLMIKLNSLSRIKMQYTIQKT